jgi:hypothetical protein
MKYIIIILSFIILFLSCKNYNIKYDITQIECKINEKSKGLDQNLKENFDIEKEIIDYSIAVYEKKGNQIQEILLDDISDKITSIEKSKISGIDVFKITFTYDKFRTSPIGYDGIFFYKVDENSGKLIKIFSYFLNAGEQDSPYFELKDFKNNESEIFLTYSYMESSGLPDVGEGTIIVKYLVNKKIKSVTFDNLKCNIIRTGKFIDGSYISNDPEYKIDPPENVIYTKEQINEKLKYLLKKYDLLY